MADVVNAMGARLRLSVVHADGGLWDVIAESANGQNSLVLRSCKDCPSALTFHQAVYDMMTAWA